MNTDLLHCILQAHSSSIHIHKLEVVVKTLIKHLVRTQLQTAMVSLKKKNVNLTFFLPSKQVKLR